MVIKQGFERIRVKELCRPRRIEVPLDVIVEPLFFEPCTDGRREACLFAVCPRVGERLVCRLTENVFCIDFVDLKFRRNLLRLLHDDFVKERDAQLQRMCHAHLVGF